MSAPAALELTVGALRVAALRSGQAGGHRVLALHGWLDNAASFLPLAAHLPGVDLVMVDLPGHGHSDHLPDGAQYTFADALPRVLDIADALGWERFTLLGHSMGAGIASMVAAAAPGRIEALVAIEALGGLSAPEDETASRLRDHLAAVRALPTKRLRVFPDLAAPVRARMMANQLGEDAARLLVERGVREVPGGYHWRTDPRLTLPTAVRLTEAQINDLVAAIECPTQVIYASPAQPYFPEPLRSQRAALLRDGRVEVLPGSHHLHMEQPAAVAACIRAFLDGLDTAAS